jgi:hypothetical protein
MVCKNGHWEFVRANVDNAVAVARAAGMVDMLARAEEGSSMYLPTTPSQAQSDAEPDTSESAAGATHRYDDDDRSFHSSDYASSDDDDYN